jgi:hypothetical protein
MNLKIKLKYIIKKIFNIFGFNPKSIIAFRHYSNYRKQKNEFEKLGGVISHNYTILTDYFEQAGEASGHYFHQDLLVASYVHKINPKRHIDIGSRVDGFIAHVASFRTIDVMDIRNLNKNEHRNISFIKIDVMNDNKTLYNITDSISCLHAIEHFGLGRYGDPIDPQGHIKGFNNIVRMLKPDGFLFISFPIGKKNEVHFNAHRVFHPMEIFNWCENRNILKLKCFDYVDDSGNLHTNVDVSEPDVVYGCGIYTFKKIHLNS